MFKIIYRHHSRFREKFVSHISHTGTASWFPGHMFKGMKQMQAKLAIVDCFLEVHDARIPFSGRNPKFYSMLTAVKPHILILNKSDLIDHSLKKDITENLQKQNVKNVMFTDCKKSSKGGISNIISTVVQMVRDSENYNRANALSLNIMAIGIPNVGKSSLINRLRNIHLQRKKATSVGAVPGVTRSVLEKIKICDDPLVYLYDTPGVIQPYIANIEIGLKLALCRTLKDNLVGEELMADYLLYWLNKHKNFSYVEYLQLKEATDDIRVLLIHIAKQLSMVQKVRNAQGAVMQVPDILGCAKYFIRAFREGQFGNLLLDIDHINKIP